MLTVCNRIKRWRGSASWYTVTLTASTRSSTTSCCRSWKSTRRFIRRRYWTTKLKTWVRRYFRDEIAPIITPIGLDPTHPFPLLVNKSLNFIVELEGIDAFGRDSGLAIIPAPRLLPRIIKVPEEVGGPGDNYVFLSSMIHAHADDLFQA